MKPRIENPQQVEPKAYQAMYSLESYVRQSDIDPVHRELIKIRASQLNKCAFCIQMHTKEARQNGESEERIYALNAWQESPYFSPEERAILALTEQVTFISEQQVTDEVYDEAVRLLGEKKVIQVIMAIATINSWNRIAISARAVPQ